MPREEARADQQAAFEFRWSCSHVSAKSNGGGSNRGVSNSEFRSINVAIENQRGKARISLVIQKNIGLSSFSSNPYGFGQLAPSGASAFNVPTNETSIT